MTMAEREVQTEALSSVHNALRVLQAFSYLEPTLGVSELSRRLGIGKSSVHRILQTMCAEKFVVKTADGRYRLGFALYEIGQLVVHGLRLRQVAHPFLERLRFATNEAVHLGVLEGSQVVYIERMESAPTIAMFDRIGQRMPAHVTSSGKCLLAWASPDRIDTVLADGLPRRAPRTITSESLFRLVLDEVRANGYSISVEESERNTASIGAPVRGSDGSVIAAVSVVGSTARINEAGVARLVPLIRKTAARISEGMGYRPSEGKA